MLAMLGKVLFTVSSLFAMALDRFPEMERIYGYERIIGFQLSHLSHYVIDES